ncbi:MAG TPA: aldo/keto reductase family protein [Planctomycetota bacterium]|nr:aldo/keto reductase family protein [Planctomycetota bacterium]
MLYRNVGSSGLKVSAVGLGSWLTIGNSVDAKATSRLVAAAFERGVNLFDTADVYARGEAERVLGASIKTLPRHRLVIATKCFFPMSDDPNDCGLSRKHVHESLSASLRRLQTDYVDLYQCHRFDPGTPLLETARAMDDLVRRGLALYWGTSQWPAEKIHEVVELCRAQGLHAPISNQPLYNLFERGIETEVMPTVVRNGLGTLVFSPLAQGVLTGKYRPAEQAPADSRAADARSNQFIGRYLTPDRLAKAQQLAQVAARAGLTAVQLALAFCLRDANITSVLVGARSTAQLEGSLAAVGVPLGADLLRDLERTFPR